VLTLIEIILWFSIAVIFYTYLGYPLLLNLLSKFFQKPVNKKQIFPTVTILIAAHNEEKVLERRIKNCLSLNYPKNKIETIIISDGSTDNTNKIVKSFSKQGVRLIHYPVRMGKAYALNKAVIHVTGEIVVFTDSRQVFDKDAIKEIVANFNDPKVGAVSGELHLKDEAKTSVGQGVTVYWEYEKYIRKHESKINSTVGATGAIYAIRKELFAPIPENTILDDFVIPMRIVQMGYRVIFEPKAKAYDEVFGKSTQEFTRKVRTLAGNFQAFLLIPDLFNPFRTKVAFQLFSHKFLRLVVPYLMLLIFSINFFLISRPLYMVTFALQLLFLSSALLGLFYQNKKNNLKRNHRISKICYTFSLLNFAAVVGCWRFARKSQKVVWKKGLEAG